jgi:hypothetical protein
MDKWFDVIIFSTRFACTGLHSLIEHRWKSLKHKIGRLNSGILFLLNIIDIEEHH